MLFLPPKCVNFSAVMNRTFVCPCHTYCFYEFSHFPYILVDHADTQNHLVNNAVAAQQCSRRTEALPSTLWPSHEGIIHLQTANINIEICSDCTSMGCLSFGLNYKCAIFHLKGTQRQIWLDAVENKIFASQLGCAA